MANKKAREDRNDLPVGKLEGKHGMKPGAICDKAGSYKQVGTIRKGTDGDDSLSLANTRMERVWKKTYNNRNGKAA